ncbi:hypothetical protein JTB14_035612 [Gonioctena quinquepunctata]|nr:hypothetical protein JTB14_035612 [Gonioctena quinquepunctata]
MNISLSLKRAFVRSMVSLPPEDLKIDRYDPCDYLAETVRTDSSPGAIKLGYKNDSDKSSSLTAEENQALMKRYLQCPGMCRVEVLKKFVRNKYNVDTSLFHIDILYKRVPLPDHYTLIDIGYIYSWKRNEPMKFYFRITDINKVSERFDYFNSQNPVDFVIRTPIRTPRNGDRTGSTKKKENQQKKNSRTSKQSSHTNDVCGENKSNLRESTDTTRVTVEKSDCDNNGYKSCENKDSNIENKVTANTDGTDIECGSGGANAPEKTGPTTDSTETDNIKNTLGKDNVPKLDSIKTESKPCIETTTWEVEKEVVKLNNEVPLQAEIPEPLKKNAVYTNITLNRTNNVEIITKIQKVSNKDGRAIGLNIIKQTVKSNTPIIKPTKKVPSNKKTPQTKPNPNKGVGKNCVAKKIEISSKRSTNENNNENILTVTANNVSTNKICNINSNDDDTKQKTTNRSNAQNSMNSSEDAEKRRFLESIELTARPVQSPTKQRTDPVQTLNGQKRKLSSPVKNETNKKLKLDKKPTTRIILQSKPKPNTLTTPSALSNSTLQSKGLKSLIESCKIPSSLSITIKDGTENNRLPSLIPPVKNYIEILKLPDESGQNAEKTGRECTSTKLDFSLKMCDNDSEQKVDEDLSQIAKSLTERIPMSTTISEIVGPKPQFTIPVTNVPLKFIQPSPVPELSNKVLSVPKENSKLNPRSPQTFQKIFEESIKKPEDEVGSSDKEGQKCALDLSNDANGTPSNGKRNISEIATQLFKKTKMELEKNPFDIKNDNSSVSKPVPKVPIPRLPNQRNLKPPQKNSKFELADSNKYQQTLTNLHSNALGLNYTISVGPNIPVKVNGIVPTVKQDSDTKACIPVTSSGNLSSFANIAASSPRPSPIPRNLSPGLGYNSPRNSPKHSPKSSPLIKHMYAPMPNLMMDQLRVNTFSQRVSSPKINNFARSSPKSSPQLPSSSANLPSPSKHPCVSPKPPASSPKSLASSPKPLSSSPKPPVSSTKPAASSPKLPASSPKLIPVSSPKLPASSPKLPASSPKLPASSPKPSASSPKMSPKFMSNASNAQASTSGLSVSTSQGVVSSKGSPKSSPSSNQASPLSPNQILEKYNIQNLAQLTASLNFNATNFGMNPSNQLAALQHAMLLKHIEMQNRQNWLNMNQGPLLQYEKYLQSLKNNHLLSNIKEN